jgi:hypothetical protein
MVPSDADTYKSFWDNPPGRQKSDLLSSIEAPLPEATAPTEIKRRGDAASSSDVVTNPKLRRSGETG